MPIGIGGLVRNTGQYPAAMEAGSQAMAKAVERPTLRESLGLQKAELEKRLAEVTDAIASLDEHPEVLGVLEKLNKLGY